MNANKSSSRSGMPIRFYKLFPGSTFRIFAEPSRDIRKSDDTTIYRKIGEGYSIAADAEDVHGTPAIILDREDLVVPLTRGQQP